LWTIPKVKLEIAADDELVVMIVETIENTAKTGHYYYKIGHIICS
jgi:nitrogen regulatory protein PII